jgi:hypothetical protein
MNDLEKYLRDIIATDKSIIGIIYEAKANNSRKCVFRDKKHVAWIREREEGKARISGRSPRA